jgi:hypothetical protein
MHSYQAVSRAQRGRRVRGRLLCVTALAVAVVASATPAVADPSAGQSPGLGVRVVGTVAVDPSRVGVIVAVPGAGEPLNAQAFRLWQNGRPEAVRVDPRRGCRRRARRSASGRAERRNRPDDQPAERRGGGGGGGQACPPRPATDRRCRFGRAGARGCDVLGPVSQARHDGAARAVGQRIPPVSILVSIH